ncbi:FY-rich, N-terminal [Sesbania bispinosa]|nr:FY-rich, N-terminal [Sesbania bispinosa]
MADKFVLFRYTMNELSTLVEALEGEPHAIKVWANIITGMASANAEEACVYEKDVESAMCKIKSYEEGKSSTSYAGINDKSNSNVPSSHYSYISSELVHSESHHETSSTPNETIDCHKGNMNDKNLVMEQGGSVDLNSDVIPGEPENYLPNIADSHHNKGVQYVEKVCYAEARKEDKNMKMNPGGIAVLEKDFSPCSSDVRNTLDGCKLFGIDLNMHSDSGEQLNNVLKMGVVDTSNTSSVVYGKLWCSKHAIYPKGFKSRVKFFSILDPASTCNYVSEVIDAGFIGPLFKVTMEEHPNEAFSNTSVDKCWETVFDRLTHEIKRRRSLGEQELPPLELLQSINGHRMFGFLSPSIIQSIEAQDPGHQCVEYWNHKGVLSDSSGREIDDKFTHGSSNSLGNIKTKLFGVDLIKLEEDNIGESCHSFEEMKLMLQGFLKKASPDELVAMQKLFNSDAQLTQWRVAIVTLIEEIQKACVVHNQN